MFKRHILVPLDGSEFSQKIIPHLCRLCDPATDAIILLRVADPAISILGGPARTVSMAWTQPLYVSARDAEYVQHPIYAMQLEQNESSALEQDLLLDKHELESLGFETTVEVRFGDPAKEIAAVVQQRSVDLIAMATHGRTGLPNLLMGSVAAQVMRRVDVPVLLVRPFHITAD